MRTATLALTFTAALLASAAALAQPAPPRSLNPSVPQPLEDICMRALVKDRDQRWQTAGEMKDALEAFIRSTGKGTTAAHMGVFMDALFPPKCAAPSAAKEE